MLFFTVIFMKKNFFNLTKFELLLWITSLTIITLSFLFCQNYDFVVLIASLIGGTALIFVSKGNPIGQILTVVFALFYGYISIKFRYYGEMIIYLGMTAPMAISATVSWLRNPFEKSKAEVKVALIGKKKVFFLCVSAVAVTVVFYFILKYFDTPNLILSTVSVFTSFLASMLTFYRNKYYALAYAANDVILIALWVLASIEKTSYIPMVACFVIFLANDLYGFYNWQRIEKKQKSLNCVEKV